MAKIHLMNFPEEVFCSHILSRLPLKEAVGFSAVARKWRRTWTTLPYLKFSDEFFSYSWRFWSNKEKGDIIKKIIRQHCVGLDRFELENCRKFGSRIDVWLLWISQLGVKCMDLNGRNNFDLWFSAEMEVSQSIFLCHKTLTFLSLTHFAMTKVPLLLQGFSRLVSCSLLFIELSEEAIVKLSCLLESLKAQDCKLPWKLRIISWSLKCLALLQSRFSTEANCPKLESIEISGCTGFEMEKICLPVCLSLVTGTPYLKHFAAVKSLKSITCFEHDVSTVGSVLQSFPHLGKLSIESSSFDMFSQMNVAGVNVQLPSLKTFVLNMQWYNLSCEISKQPLNLCSCILKGAPLLETIRIIMLGYRSQAFEALFRPFINGFLSLESDFPKTKISVSRRRR